MEIRDKRRLPFVQIEKALVMSRDLTHTAFRVYCALASRANAAGKAWPSLRRMAEDIGLSHSCVAKAVRQLERLTLIRIERSTSEHGDAAANVYAILGWRVSADTGGHTGDHGVSLGDHGGHGEERNENTLNEKEDSLSLVPAREGASRDTLTPELRAYAAAQGCTDPDDCFEGYVLQFAAAKRSARRFQRWARDGHGGPAWKACRCQTRLPPGTPQAARAAPIARGLSGVQAVARKLQLAGEL